MEDTLNNQNIVTPPVSPTPPTPTNVPVEFTKENPNPDKFDDAE